MGEVFLGGKRDSFVDKPDRFADKLDSFEGKRDEALCTSGRIAFSSINTGNRIPLPTRSFVGQCVTSSVEYTRFLFSDSTKAGQAQKASDEVRQARRDELNASQEES